MNSKRLQFLANYIAKDANVIDIGTDHAYLPILLVQKNKRKVIGTDIHEKALNQAQKNVLKYHLEKEIKLILTDGLENINFEDYDTLVLAGMGYMTIKHILDSDLKPIQTIILQANNDHEKVRKMMMEKNWRLIDEHLLSENNHLYHIMKYQKGEEQLTNQEIMLGKYLKENRFYYQEELVKCQEIYDKIPQKYFTKRKELQKKISFLQEYLNL